MNQNEEALAALESAWYEVIDAVMTGRTAQLPCPECHADGLRVEEQGDRITVTCPACQRSVEFQNQSA